MQFSLIIPLWNEAENIPALIKMFDEAELHNDGLVQMLLINNGSSDQTGELIEEASKTRSWIKTIQLQENLNYGGGVYHGLSLASSDIVAYIPGDLQVQADDVAKVWSAFRKTSESYETSQLMVKGRRTVRKDPFSTRLSSVVYTMLANMVLGLRISDLNGLPKMFHKSLLNELPEERAIDFVFDAQLIHAARRRNWKIEEIPVTFHGRREGVSSWSGKRFRTYWNTTRQIFAQLNNLS